MLGFNTTSQIYYEKQEIPISESRELNSYVSSFDNNRAIVKFDITSFHDYSGNDDYSDSSHGDYFDPEDYSDSSRGPIESSDYSDSSPGSYHYDYFAYLDDYHEFHGYVDNNDRLKQQSFSFSLSYEFASECEKKLPENELSEVVCGPSFPTSCTYILETQDSRVMSIAVFTVDGQTVPVDTYWSGYYVKSQEMMPVTFTHPHFDAYQNTRIEAVIPSNYAVLTISCNASAVQRSFKVTYQTGQRRNCLSHVLTASSGWISETNITEKESRESCFWQINTRLGTFPVIYFNSRPQCDETLKLHVGSNFSTPSFTWSCASGSENYTSHTQTDSIFIWREWTSASNARQE